MVSAPRFGFLCGSAAEQGRQHDHDCQGNRSQQVTDACKKYAGSTSVIGGPAAVLAEENIKKVVCIDFAELGMEAVWKIEVENFPAFILVDDKGNDFFKQLGL